MAHSRQHLEACIDSYGGGHASEVAPWIGNVNYPKDSACWNQGAKTTMRRFLAMLRAHDINEMMLYSPSSSGYGNDPNGSIPAWTDFAELVDEVWWANLCSAKAVSSEYGGYEGAVANLVFADHSSVQIQSQNQGIDRASLFDPNSVLPTGRTSVTVFIETTSLDCDMSVTVSLGVFSGSPQTTPSSWSAVGEISLLAGEAKQWHGSVAANSLEHLDDNGMYWVRVEAATEVSAGLLDVGLVQLVASD